MHNRNGSAAYQRKDASGGEGNPANEGEINKELKRISDDVKSFGTDFMKKLEKGQNISDELKGKVDEALTKSGELLGRLDAVEQKLTRANNGQPTVRKSIGQEFTTGEGFEDFAKDQRAKKSFVHQYKTIVNITSATSGTGAAGDAIVPDRQTQIYGLPQRRLTVRDLITPGRTSSSSIEYVKQTGFQNSAAVVAEAASKPQSDMSFDLITTNVATIAHWAKASKQILDDVPQLESFIDGQMIFGLEFVEESQLLNGSGMSGNLNGIYTQATAYSQPAGGMKSGVTQTAIDVLRLALLQAELALFPSTGIVLNPTQWSAIELTKDSTGRYIIGDPKSQLGASLWGRPVVTTPSMTNDTFLVGAFKLGAQVFDRELANVQVSTEDSDNFTKNMVTIRAEERLALAVYRPEAFIKGDLGLVT